jgi:hypothetical protein
VQAQLQQLAHVELPVHGMACWGSANMSSSMSSIRRSIEVVSTDAVVSDIWLLL